MFDQVCVFAGASYCTVMEIQQSHSTGHTSSTARHKVFGSRRRCEQLQSLNEEYYVLSLLDVLLAQQRVRQLVLYTTIIFPSPPSP